MVFLYPLLFFKTCFEESHKFFGFSYCGAQIFEIYGLGKEIVDLAFCGSVSSVGGLTLDEVRNTIRMKHLVYPAILLFRLYFCCQ